MRNGVVALEDSLARLQMAKDEAESLLQEPSPRTAETGILSVVGVGTGEEPEDSSDSELGAPRFPIEALPKTVQDFVTEAAASLPVPIDLIAAPALVCLGAAIGAHRAIQLKPDWTARAALYLACIADPGSLKTPALNLVASPIYRQQERYKEAHTLALSQYDEAVARYHRDLDAHKKRETDAIPSKSEKPIFQRTWTADVTTEALGGLLSENPQGILILRDELSAWIKSFNQYRNGNGSDKQFFLSAWSGEPLAVDRKGKDPVLVSRPFLSVLGCVPPDVLPDLDEDNREDGFLHRLLFAYPNPIPVRWPSAVLRDTTKQAYVELVARLYGLQPHPDGSCVVLHLSPTAKALFVEWHDSHCQEQENHALPAMVRGAYAKLKGYAPRFALIHAVASNPFATQVEEESVGAALELVEYFKIQVQRVAPLLGSHARTPAGRCEQSIRRALAQGRCLTKRTIQRNGNADGSLFNQVWKSLLEQGAIVRDPSETHRQVYRLKGSTL